MNIKKILLLIVGVIIIISIIIFKTNTSVKTNQENDSLVLADASVVWWMAPSLIASEKEIYSKHGLNISSFDVQTGLASMNAVISGNADIGLVASTPLAQAAFNKENLVVIGSYVESNSLLALLTEKSEYESKEIEPIPNNPIALVKGTISELYYYNYMKKYHPEIDLEKINQVHVRPPDVPNVLNTESASSAVIWEPFATQIDEGNPNIQSTRLKDIYTMRIYIVTTPEILESKKEAVEKFIESISESCDLLSSDKSVKHILYNKFPQQKNSMNLLWNDVDFSLKFDYSKMSELLQKEADLLFELGYTPQDENGDFRKLGKEDTEHYFNHSFSLN